MAVLLFLMVVAAVITPFVLAARTDFLLASGTFRKDRQTHLAEGLVKLTARQVAGSTEELNEALRFNSEPVRTVCGDKQIEVRIQDQMSLVDINAASVDLLDVGFAAMGFPDGDAGKLAELAALFRSPEASDPGGKAKQLTDGFKFAPFEAVEELYEFPGFAGVAPRRLTGVFTVYGRRETINADNMPAPLDEILPNGPTGRFPYVVTDDEDASRFYRIEVTTRSGGDRTVGFAGSLIEITDFENARYRVVERSTEPGMAKIAAADFTATVDCDRLFGEEVAEWLAGT